MELKKYWWVWVLESTPLKLWGWLKPARRIERWECHRTQHSSAPYCSQQYTCSWQWQLTREDMRGFTLNFTGCFHSRVGFKGPSLTAWLFLEWLMFTFKIRVLKIWKAISFYTMLTTPITKISTYIYINRHQDLFEIEDLNLQVSCTCRHA